MPYELLLSIGFNSFRTSILPAITLSHLHLIKISLPVFNGRRASTFLARRRPLAIRLPVPMLSRFPFLTLWTTKLQLAIIPKSFHNQWTTL